MANNSSRTILGIVAAMTGATTGVQGTSGSVPVPAAGKQTAFLRGDATFAAASTVASGSPVGTVTGQPGDIYVDSGTNNLYVKTSGANNTAGWTGITGAATWQTYTLSVTAPTTNPTTASAAVINAAYMVIGKTMYINITIGQPNQTGATAGTGTYNFSIPAGFTIDTSKAPLPSSTGQAASSGYDGATVGSYNINNSTANYGGRVVPLTTTTLGLFGSNYGGGNIGLRGSSNGGVFTEGTGISSYGIFAQIPIL